MPLSQYQIKVSQLAPDDEWDNFVEFTAGGHFEQTSRWAQVKKEEGWESVRIIIRLNTAIVAGCQILLRRLPVVGKAGYIPKGPLIQTDDSVLAQLVVRAIKDVLHEHRIVFVIAHAPYNSRIIDEALAMEGFAVENSPTMVKTATSRIDLQADPQAILSKMSRTCRYNIGYARRNGVVLHEGTKADISSFFGMMLDTCHRIGVQPNPATEGFVHKLWELFFERGNLRLFLAECQGEIVAARMAIPFGRVLYDWKVGWTGKYQNLHPNNFLVWEIMRWAKDRGYLFFDFMGLSNRRIAETLLNGGASYSELKGQDLFKIGFGGDVILLPQARTFISNPLFRFSYRTFYPSVRAARSKIRNCVST